MGGCRDSDWTWFVGWGNRIFLADAFSFNVIMSLEHEFGTRLCWCNPRLAKPCNECGDNDLNCWKCDEIGLVTTHIGDPGDIVIIHIDNTGL